MRSYKIIIKILHSKKQLIKSLIHLIAIFLIVSYIMQSFFLTYSSYIRYVWPIKYAKYDVQVLFTTEKEYREQIDQNNVEAEVMFTNAMLRGKFIHGNKEYYNLNYLEANNVYGVSLDEPLRTVVDIILPGCIINKDDNLLSLDNAILLSDIIAVKIGAKVGDTVYMQLPVTEVIKLDDKDKDGFYDDLKYEFKVAAVYRETNIGNAIVHDSIYQKIGKDLIGAAYNERYFDFKNYVFIKFNDVSSGMNEVETFIPTDLNSYVNHGDNWKQDPSSEFYLKNARSNYRTRSQLLASVEQDSVIDTKVIIFQTLLITIAISLLYINKNYKALKLNRNSFGILSSSGFPRKKIVIYIFTSTMVQQVIILALSHLFLSIKYWISGSWQISLIYNPLVIENMYKPFILSILLTTLVSGFFALHTLRKNKLLEALSTE